MKIDMSRTRDIWIMSIALVALMWLIGFAIGEALSALPRDYEFRPRDEVRLVFNPGEFVPAGGLTDKGHLVALRADSRGYVICSPTVILEVVPK